MPTPTHLGVTSSQAASRPIVHDFEQLNQRDGSGVSPPSNHLQSQVLKEIPKPHLLDLTSILYVQVLVNLSLALLCLNWTSPNLMAQILLMWIKRCGTYIF